MHLLHDILTHIGLLGAKNGVDQRAFGLAYDLLVGKRDARRPEHAAHFGRDFLCAAVDKAPHFAALTALKGAEHA